MDHLESTRKLMTPAALREVVLHDIQASPELREALARNPKIALDAQGAYRYKVGGLPTPRVSSACPWPEGARCGHPLRLLSSVGYQQVCLKTCLPHNGLAGWTAPKLLLRCRGHTTHPGGLA